MNIRRIEENIPYKCVFSAIKRLKNQAKGKKYYKSGMLRKIFLNFKKILKS